MKLLARRRGSGSYKSKEMGKCFLLEFKSQHYVLLYDVLNN